MTKEQKKLEKFLEQEAINRGVLIAAKILLGHDVKQFEREIKNGIDKRAA